MVGSAERLPSWLQSRGCWFEPELAEFNLNICAFHHIWRAFPRKSSRSPSNTAILVEALRVSGAYINIRCYATGTATCCYINILKLCSMQLHAKSQKLARYRFYSFANEKAESALVGGARLGFEEPLTFI